MSYWINTLAVLAAILVIFTAANYYWPRILRWLQELRAFLDL